ncbi:unnamed protein product [Blepharisma stoltei]|uniref:Uncharacterized protein n=1 Tax=Blepharisma stoltei TaxID=1481888 RepID=A0AAU9K938_9CILI|nr:unnamed protein product [Blepharisma stoltei]
MKLLWWLHLLLIIPSYYATANNTPYFRNDRKIPYILSSVFLANYFPLLFSEALYDGFFWLVTSGWDYKYFSEEILWLSTPILIFARQHISVYSLYSFWIFGIISILLCSKFADKLSNFWLSLPGLFNSLSLLFYYSISSSLEYFLYYFVCFSIFIIWGKKIRYYWFTSPSPVFYFYNISMLTGTLLAIKTTSVSDNDLIAWIVWILCVGLTIGLPVMIFVYFGICFDSALEPLRSSNQEFIHKYEKDKNYLHNHEFVFCIFQYYIQIFSFVFAMILTASIFEEIFGSWNRILVELFYLATAAIIGNVLLYPNWNWNSSRIEETFNIQMNILGIYAQIWFLRILAKIFNNSIWT